MILLLRGGRQPSPRNMFFQGGDGADRTSADPSIRAARYSGQVYKRAYDLCLYLEQIVGNFSRYQKPVLSSEQRERIEGYSLGTDLRDGARRVLKLVVRANARHDKVPVLLQMREEIEELKVLLRLGHDVKAFANFNSFEHAILQVTEIATRRR